MPLSVALVSLTGPGAWVAAYGWASSETPHPTQRNAAQVSGRVAEGLVELRSGSRPKKRECPKQVIHILECFTGPVERKQGYESAGACTRLNPGVRRAPESLPTLAIAAPPTSRCAGGSVSPQSGTATMRFGAPVSDPARDPRAERAPGRRPALRPACPCAVETEALRIPACFCCARLVLSQTRTKPRLSL